MDTTHLHLLLNHFPIIGSVIGSALLAWGIIKKQDTIKIPASAILVAMAILAIPVFLTGEPAEEMVEDLPGVSESMIHLHESAAEIAIWIMGITGIAALAAIWFGWGKKPMAKMLFNIVLLLSLVSFAAMARTGYYGGQIRHSEIRNGSNTGEKNEGKEQKDGEKNGGKEQGKGKGKEDD